MVLTVNSSIVEPEFDTVPVEMMNLNNWVVWKAEKSTKVNNDGEQILEKVLKRTNGRAASSTDNQTWTDFHNAYQSYVNKSFDGIGFVFEKNNKIIGLDLDGHIEDGEPVTKIAEYICKQTYVEISPSGTGAHAYFIGDMPKEFKKKFKDDQGELEIYNDGRYFTFTGVMIGQSEISKEQSVIDMLVETYFYKEEPTEVDTEKRAHTLPSSEIKRKMFRNDKIKKLFNGDTSKYQDDDSSADMALCNHLAFWTGKNRYQMDEIFRESGLMRDKWDEPRGSSTYGFYTIDKAISECKNVYKLSINNPKKSEDYVWDEIVTFDADEVLPFPTNIFPDWLENYIDQVAQTTQTPREMAAMGAFTALSIATAKKFNIVVYDSWIEPLNTYLLTLMPPASRKSQVFKDMTKPIIDYQKDRREFLKHEIARNEHDLDIAERRITSLKKRISEPKPKDNVNELEETLKFEIDSLEDMERIKEPTYIADDVTSEVLERLLKDNDERMAIVSPEGGMFSNMSRYSDVANLDVFLKGHPAERLSSHRLSRDAVELEEPHLTVGLFAQPTVIQEVPEQFFKKGLMARFLYSMPTDNRGDRQVRPRGKDPETASIYYNNLKSLMNIQTDGINLKLSREADMYVQALQEEIEMRQGYKEDLRENEEIESWAGKLVGQLMRLAGLIHMSTVLSTSDYTVQADTIQKIERLKDYFISHAKKAFTVTNVDPDVADAEYLLERILEMNEDGQLKRQKLWQMVKKKFGKSSSIEPPLNILIDREYIKIVNVSSSSGRGPKTKMIILNPILQL